MQSIRRTVLSIAVTLLAVFVGSGTALAGPPPLIEPEQGGAATVVDPQSSSGGFFDSWPQVTLAVVVGLAVIALLAFGASRLYHHSHHAPSAA